MANRPSAVAFDVVETLMTLEPLAARFERAGLPPSALGAWFTRCCCWGWGCRQQVTTSRSRRWRPRRYERSAATGWPSRT